MRARVEDSNWPQISSVTQKGQITIPSMMRKELDIRTGSLVKIVFSGSDRSINITPIMRFEKLRGSLKRYIKE